MNVIHELPMLHKPYKKFGWQLYKFFTKNFFETLNINPLNAQHVSKTISDRRLTLRNLASYIWDGRKFTL